MEGLIFGILRYPSSLLLKYFNIGVGDKKALLNRVTGKYFVYYGLKTSTNIFYTPHDKRDRE